MLIHMATYGKVPDQGEPGVVQARNVTNQTDDMQGRLLILIESGLHDAWRRLPCVGDFI